MYLIQRITLFAAVAATLVLPAFAELARSDRYFLEQAAKGGLKEIDVSEQALVHLNSPDVRNFAQQMLNDHRRMNTELQTLATQKGVFLPPSDAKVAARWTDNRKELEDDYLAEMTNDHRETIELFEKAAKSEDPDIAAFALKTLPHLREHLQTVKQLKKIN
jgi:putative membrane protein